MPEREHPRNVSGRRLRHISKKSSGKPQLSPPSSSGLIDSYRPVYRDHTPSVRSLFSPQAPSLYHPPSQEDILTHSPNYKRELLPPAFSPGSTEKTYTPVTTYNLKNTALLFPKFLQKILCLQ